MTDVADVIPSTRGASHLWLAIVHFDNGPRELWLRAGCVHVRVPSLTSDGFGMSEYAWDGVERDSDGRRVFR